MTETLKRILLTDDDDIACEVALSCLEKDDRYEVKVCRSGQECLDTIEDFMPQLVLLDVMMPDMDGMETLKKLRGRYGLSILPAAFLTGRADAAQVEDYFKLGALGVIAKPFNPAKLNDEVNDIWTLWLSTYRRARLAPSSTNLYD